MQKRLENKLEISSHDILRADADTREISINEGCRTVLKFLLLNFQDLFMQKCYE